MSFGAKILQSPVLTIQPWTSPDNDGSTWHFSQVRAVHTVPIKGLQRLTPDFLLLLPGSGGDWNWIGGAIQNGIETEVSGLKMLC